MFSPNFTKNLELILELFLRATFCSPKQNTQKYVLQLKTVSVFVLKNKKTVIFK